MDLIGTDGSRRVDTAWQYDASGNTVRLWRGDPSFTGSNAVEKWSFSFDNPALPATTTVTDPLGKVATYTIGRDTVSDKPRVTAIAGDCPSCGLGPNAQLLYDDAANPLLPTRTIDGRGTTTAFTYNADGLPASRTEAMGTPLERTTTWQYGGPFPSLVTRVEQPSTSGAGVRATVYAYDGVGNLTGQTISGVEAGSAFSYTTTSAYNGAGRPLSVDPPGYAGQDVTSYAYDPARGDLYPTSRTEPLVGATTFAYDPFNRLVSRTDPNGVATETAYDAGNRELSNVQKGATPAEDLVISRTYNAFGDLLRTTFPRGNVTEYGYDAAGRLITVERKPDAATANERTVYTLDGSGNHTREESQRWNGSAWTVDSFTSYVYSTRCHLDKVIHADGTVTEFAYDCEGNPERTWDANHPSANQGNPATQVNTYDLLNRLTATTRPWGGGGGGSATAGYAYDAQDHLIRVTDANGTVTTYTESDRDLLTSETSEVSGTTLHAYNEHGVEVGTTSAANVTVNRTADALDRVTFEDFPDNSLDTSYTWDDPAVPFSKGRLTAVARNGAAVAYAYDRFGRRLQDGDLHLTYDRNGNPLTVAYPGAVTGAYTYDSSDRQASLTLQDGAGPAQALVSGASYKAFGPLTGLTLGNGLTEARAWDADDRPAGISVPGRLDWTYTLDAVGNVTAIADNLSSGASRSFAYQDVQSYLVQADGPWGPRAWTYDRAGNRLTETRGGVTDTYAYAPNAAGGGSPRLSQITAGSAGSAATQLFYDAEGNLTFRSQAADKLRYSYDAGHGLTQLRADNGTLFSQLFYDGRQLLARATFSPFAGAATPAREVTASYSSRGTLFLRTDLQHRTSSSPRNQPEIRDDGYVFYFAGRPVALYAKHLSTPATGAPSASTRLLYLTSDHLGAPILATDAAGATVWQGGFEPFGKDWNGARAAGVFLRLPGQWDDETWSPSGLSYNVHRWYEAGTGHYSQPDPLGLQGGNVHPLNLLYGYADDNPEVYTDPLGLVKTRHCDDKGQVKAIEAAVQQAKQALKNPRKGCKVCDADKPKMLTNIDNATYYCADDVVANFYSLPAGVCGGTRNDHGQHDGMSITLLYPQVTQPSQCGCLQGTIFHEATHNVLDTSDLSDTNNAYDVTHSCIPCARSR